MALDVGVVLTTATKHPEVAVKWTLDEIVKDSLGDTVVKALHRIYRDQGQDVMLALLDDARRHVYKDYLADGIAVLGKPFVRFQMFTAACDHAKVHMKELDDSNCPSHMEGPADIVYSTMFLDHKLKQMDFMAARMKELKSAAAARQQMAASVPTTSTPSSGSSHAPNKGITGPVSKAVKEEEPEEPVAGPSKEDKKTPEPASKASLGDIESNVPLVQHLDETDRDVTQLLVDYLERLAGE